LGEEKGLAKSDSTALAIPLVSPEEAGLAMATYQKLCNSILIPWDKRTFDKDDVLTQDSDFQRIRVKDRGGKSYERDFPKKSAFRKLALFYGVSTELVSSEKKDKPDSSFTWSYIIKASVNTKDGKTRFTTGEGTCDSKEMSRGEFGNVRVEHDTKATAWTRAVNRAVSDLIGFGQVSAEEMTAGGSTEPRKVIDSDSRVVEDEPPTQPQTPPPKQQPSEPQAKGSLASIKMPPKVSANWMKYTLEELGVNTTDKLTITEDLQSITILKKANLDDTEFKTINRLVELVKGTYDTKPAVHWKIAIPR
jgi:hypothetical protein